MEERNSDPEGHDEKCDECFGRGELLCRTPSGHGNIEEWVEECDQCGGTGWVFVKNPTREEWHEKYGVENE